MTEKIMGEIYLEPEEGKIKNAAEIAAVSESMEKFIFTVFYALSDKEIILSELKRIGAVIVNHTDKDSAVTVKMSMEQLAAMKTLECVERVEMPEQNKAETISMKYSAEATPIVVSQVSNENEISLLCYGDGGSTGSNCDNSNTMQTAHYLPLSSWVNGCICCPGAEIWYRFTAGISNASEYIIYSSGSLDVVAYLYDSNGNYITQGDDEAGFPNFRITRQLTYGRTYYVKVKAYGNNTGNYNIRINYNIASSGGNNDDNCSNNMASAINLSLNSWRSGEICCPGAEIWYKFTPSTAAYYTIYTVGSLDTYGYLYDSNGTEIDHDDDEGSGLNFKMVQRLTANQTYYIKAKAYGSNTGYFSIAVTSTVFVETVSINQSYVHLDKGETENLIATVTPSYATNKTLRWETGDASVATVNQNGVVTARGAGTTCICAYSQDGSNKSSCCEVSVNVPVESVTINTSSLLMRVGEYDYLYAEVCPTDAVNKLIRWSSTNTGVVWVNEATGRVEARGVGSATIYATAQDGTGVKGSCTVQVEPPIPVQGIDICCETYTMNVGETTYLSYDIYPADATNKNVTWCSSNPNIAEVDASNGRVTTKKVGETIITVTTNDGNFVASCELSVKERVIISKDGNYSNVRFNDGKVWKCNLYVYDSTLESNQPVDNQRANHNASIDFTEKQLGFLFRIDPNGVIYYVKNKSLADDKTPTDYLIYRDNIFKEIYGRSPRFFNYENEQLYYYTGINYDNRYSVYSEAELIFGMLPRWTLQNVVETLFGAALAIISAYCPALSFAMLTAEIISGYFFTNLVENATNAAAEMYIQQSYKPEYASKLSKQFAWAIEIVKLIPSLLESALPPDIDEAQIAIYENAYQNESYMIKISDNNKTVDLNEFIEHYKSLIPRN